MSDFLDFNLWMFFVAEVLGFGLCYLWPRFASLVVPIFLLISIAYLFNGNPSEYQPIDHIPRRPGVVPLVVAVSFAIALPLLEHSSVDRQKTVIANFAKKI